MAGPDWNGIIERAVDRNPVSVTLIRIGNPDVEVTLNATPIQYKDTTSESTGTAQTGTRWMVPARRLAATTFPKPPRVGDMLLVPSLGVEARVEIAEPGFAGGEPVRWDLTILGPQA